MSELSRFYGVIVTIYGFDHNPPHIHARYGSRHAQFSIKSGDLIAGSLARKETRFVQAWIERERDSIMRAWERARAGLNPGKVKPL